VLTQHNTFYVLTQIDLAKQSQKYEILQPISEGLLPQRARVLAMTALTAPLNGRPAFIVPGI
jgi:hypothetical protein